MYKNQPTASQDTFLIAAFGLLSAFLVITAIIGGYHNYSFIPLWDMWKGYLSFFERVQSGHWLAWLELHNEHFIVLARGIFWIDLAWFSGSGWFLLIANYVLLALLAWFFWVLLDQITGHKCRSPQKTLLGCFMIGWLFCWCQYQNLIWGFENQFFTAQLLPLCSFYCLHQSISHPHQSISHPHHRWYFGWAALFGVLSAGTMANGLLTLPLMVFYVCLCRQSLTRILILIILTISIMTIISHVAHLPNSSGFRLNPPSWSQYLQKIKQDPQPLIIYLLLYLGSPFFYLTGLTSDAWVISVLAGAIWIIMTIFYTIILQKSQNKSSLQLALWCFMIYQLGTGMGITLGRYLGCSPFASRYTTSPLIAWATLLLVFSPKLLALPSSLQRKISWFVLILMAPLMIHLQAQAWHRQDPIYDQSNHVNGNLLFDRKVGVLADVLGMNDLYQFNSFTYLPHTFKADIHHAMVKKLAIFGRYPFQDIQHSLGHFVNEKPLPDCQGQITRVETNPFDNHFDRVMGWLSSSSESMLPDRIRILNEQHQVVGYAITHITPKSPVFRVNYQGYVLHQQQHNQLILQAENQSRGPLCHLSAYLPHHTYLENRLPYPMIVNGPMLQPQNEWLLNYFLLILVVGLPILYLTTQIGRKRST